VAAERAGEADLAVLQMLVEQMDEALGANRLEEWSALNARFHLSISALTGMPNLQQMLERVLDLWNRVRRWFFRGVLVYRARSAQTEHHDLLDQIRRRDVRGLEATIRRHN